MSILIDHFAAFTFSGLLLGCLYALVAFGYTIVFRVVRLFNFAQGGVFMVATIGALQVAVWLDAHEATSPLEAIAIFGATAAAAIVVGVVLSIGLEYSLFRPIRLRHGGGLPVLIAGLGALTFMQEAVALTRGRDPISVPVPLSDARLFTILGASVYPRDLLLLCTAVAVIVAIDRYVAGSRLGRAVRAVGKDPSTATLMGISVTRIVLLGFVLAGATAGIAAALSNVYFGSTSWVSGFDLGIKGVTAALLGGMGNTMAALVGGLVLGLLESYGGAVVGAQWQDVIAFVVLAVLLLARPRGLIGERASELRA